MRTCWKCTKEVPAGLKQCPYCSVPLEREMVDRMATVVEGVVPELQIVTGMVVAGRYEIKRKLGQGGMGVVYLAHDRVMGEDLAIKAVPPELSLSPAASADLKREVETCRKLNHPHIIRIHNLERWEGQSFILMEYVAGETLEHLLVARGGKLSLKEALPILRQIALALDYTHNQNPAIVHRDLKPQNIFMTADNEVKVADFGLARALSDSASKISRTSQAGSPAYMAPEQVRGKGVGPWSDIYALASTAYHLLSGQPPFHSGEITYQIINEIPEPIPGQSKQVNEALLAGLTKEPKNRPASAGALVSMLAGEARVTSGGRGPGKKAANKKGLLLAVVAVLLVLAGAGWYFLKGKESKPVPEVTSTPAAARVAMEPAVQPIGDVIISSTPTGAEVYLDGEKKGVTPLNLAGLAQGVRSLELRKEGYEPWSGRAEVVPQATARVVAELTKKPAPAAVVASGPKKGDIWTEPVTGMEFMWVPGGCFQMGSPESERRREPDEQQHEVCVDGFYMGKYEVTNKEFRLYKAGHDSGNDENLSLNGDTQPVVRVSWEEAEAYGKWLSGKSGKTVRLPTEAEWEYAARAGSKTSHYWGDNPDDACAFANVADQTAKKKWPDWTWLIHECADGFAVSAPVGSFQPNGFGLYDMLGNVWEWSQDWYGEQYYSTSPRNNPKGLSSKGANRVFRGGGWDDFPRLVRSAYRGRGSPGIRYDDLGFRLVLLPSGQ